MDRFWEPFKTKRMTQSLSLPPNKPPKHFEVLRNTWKPHTKKIILTYLLVVVPMVTFTVTVLWIVLSSSINLHNCPYPDLCPNLGAVDGSAYYIDFPAGRLAFVSSLSSTISFALVAALMTMYGFVAAQQFLSSSQTPGICAGVPTPYETSILMSPQCRDGFAMGHWLTKHATRVSTSFSNSHGKLITEDCFESDLSSFNLSWAPRQVRV
jgi:hypothetical protein